MRRKVPAALLTVPLFLLAAGCGGGNRVIDGAAGTPSAAAQATTSAPSVPATSIAPGTPSPAGTSQKPTSAPGAPPVAPSRSCGSPAFTTSDPDGGWSSGGYYVHNNMWNQDEAGPETLHACAYNNWYVDSTQTATTSVKTYPNVHKDINNMDGKPFDGYSVISSTFAGRGPGTGIYDVAYDVWLNGVGDGNGVTELMVWTENVKQVPSGDKVGTYSGYDVWVDGSGYIAFVSQATRYSGSVDLKAMISWAIGKGYMPKNPTVNQIGYGIEFCSTGGGKARFTLTDFSVTMS